MASLGLFARVLFKIHRIFNEGLPCQLEAQWYLVNRTQSRVIRQVLIYWIYDWTLVEISEELKVTRERVRQCLLKGCRDVRSYDSNSVNLSGPGYEN